jgi:hypothetical protein
MQCGHVHTETDILSVTPSSAVLNRAESPRVTQSTASPDGAFAILKKVSDKLSSQLRVLSQPAILPARKPFRAANPKTPIASGQEASNLNAWEMLALWRLPRYAPNAIEAEQAEFGAEPEITVGRLSD